MIKKFCVIPLSFQIMCWSTITPKASYTRQKNCVTDAAIAASVTQKLACRSGPRYVGALSPVSPGQ